MKFASILTGVHTINKGFVNSQDSFEADIEIKESPLAQQETEVKPSLQAKPRVRCSKSRNKA